MKTHTSQFKQKIKEFGRELDSIITYTLNNEEVELGAEELNSVTPHYEGSILKSVMKQLDIDSNVEIPLNTVINFQFGVKTSNEEVQDYRDNYDYINFGNYVVYNVEKQEDTGSYKITCYDKMLYSMKDYESVGVTYPITIRSYINAICTHLGLTFSNINDTFANYNREIQNELYLDADNNTLGFTFRDVLDQLAQVTASTICINEDDELEIRYINNTNDTINEEYLKDINVNFGEQYGPINTIVLSRSAGSDNVYYPATLPQNPNEIKISDNQIMNFNDRADYLPDIYAKLNGLQYYLNDFASTGITYYDICDRYNVQIEENTYSCIMFNDEINITQGLEENIHTDMPEESETDYTKADKTDRKINQTYLIVNKQLGIIEAKVDEVANISTDASGYGSVTLENIADSEPIEVVVKANREDISYLYPRNDLFPSDDLYFKVRDILFTSGENTITYTIPDDLLHYSDSIYDEFHLDFLNKKCQIIKRVGINDGVKYILSEEETIDYEYPTIHLTEGNWTVSLPSFSTSYVYAKMMVKNDYTSQTASKVELNAQLDLKIDKDDDGQIVSMINASADLINLTGNRVEIHANNFDLNRYGNIKCRNAELTGMFSNYSSNGNLAVRISGTLIKFYDYEGTGNLAGVLCSTRDIDTHQIIGINLYTLQGNRVTLGYKDNESDTTINSLLQFDTRDTTKPPYIANTMSGTLFSKAGGITIQNGLITDWDLNTVSGTIFPSNPDGGIVVKNGLITDWNLAGYSYKIGVKSSFGDNLGLYFKNGLLIDVKLE